ncbi:MAG: hypothetical protein NVSMB28_21280 [Collimonas sp.]
MLVSFILIFQEVSKIMLSRINLCIFIGTVLFWAVMGSLVFGHDRARPELDSWFNRLKSDKGLCCSYADGEALSEVDWKSEDGHYKVRLKDQWIDVPDDAVIKEPNLAGQTWVWPLHGIGGVTIRCFMVGPLS